MPRSARPQARRSALQALPAVDQLLQRVAEDPAVGRIPRARTVHVVREVLAAERRRLLQDPASARDAEPADLDALCRRVVRELGRAGVFSLVPVINATGVVLHTNLGRALLSPLALERLRCIGAAYSNLELDLRLKERGSRYVHVEGLLQRLTGAPASLVVNNNAAAVLLALDTLARGREVLVSRGELIEIGGEFRLPDIMRRSGAILREVGTTNRTHLRDYAEAIGPDTALLLKVHTSNYRVVGFTAEVPTRDLVELGRSREIPVMEDLGSGCLVDLRPHGFPAEPTVQEALAAGIDLVCFSGDKLLGGPQAGLVVGKADLVERLRKNPLNRALRIDKLTLAGLEATLYAYEAGSALEAIPTLRMLTEPVAAVRRRARRLLQRLAPDVRAALGAHVVEGWSQVGGGALPLAELATAAVGLGSATRPAQDLDAALRAAEPPVIGRIVEDRLLLDCRTVQPADVPVLTRVLSRVAASA